ncbi:MAG: S8 family serine peptidase [Paracoccaceae bacterium]|nr:MAG: S8 family serine peptidase [Paracoccaceae bacterium]
MTKDDSDDAPPADRRRRTLLRRLGATALGLPLAALAGPVRADDDDDGDDDDGDDDDDDDDDDDRSSFGDRDRAGRGDDARRNRRAAGRSQPPAPRSAPPRPPEIVVILPAGGDPAVILSAGYRVIATGQGPLRGASVLRLGLPPGRSPADARAEVQALLPGSLADENHLYRPDELLCRDGDCAAHAMIGWAGWPSAWAPRIGMIDTGVNVNHDALNGQRITVHQIPLTDLDAAGRQHGTAIAAQLVGRMDSRVPGLLPLAELVAVEAFHVGAGGDAADAFSLAQAVETLIDARVSVINMSFSGPDNAVLRQLVQDAGGAGIGLVAAAGNGGPGAPPGYPAAWPEVIAVTAVDGALRPYRQGNRGPYVTLAAPGVNLWTAASISGGRLRSGTSYAAPFVTAALAVERLRRPDAPVAEVVTGMVACARDLGDAGFDEVFGHGLVSSPSQCTTGGYLVSGE